MKRVVTTWVCDECGKESEPLKMPITSGISLETPTGWEYWDRPLRQSINVDGITYVAMMPIGFMHDNHFCCAEHKTAWLERQKQITKEKASGL